MDVKNIQIPSSITDPNTRRFIQYLISLIAELDGRVKKLEP